MHKILTVTDTKPFYPEMITFKQSEGLYTTKKDLVVETIREAIISGRLKPDQKLLQNEIAAQLQMSPTPVREALKQLEVEGLLVYSPHKGVRVANFSLQEASEIYRIWGALEALAIRLATPNLDHTNREHLLGTDKYGRDMLSRIIWGSRVSLQIGIIAVGIGAVSGTILGLIAGYFGQEIDALIMRVVDMLLTLPMLVLALTMVALLGSSLVNVMIAIGISMLPSFARVIRGSVLSVRERDYVMAARSIGAGHTRIMLPHILPNTFSPILILGTMRIGSAIIIESSLSFVGLGVEYGRPTWGAMIAEGRAFLQSNPWVSIAPGVAIMLTVSGFSLFGDGLRETLDPHLRD